MPPVLHYVYVMGENRKLRAGAYPQVLSWRDGVLDCSSTLQTNIQERGQFHVHVGVLALLAGVCLMLAVYKGAALLFAASGAFHDWWLPYCDPMRL